MSGTIKRFGFRTTMGPTPAVRITLANNIRLGDGEIALTAGMTVAEIDTNIELLETDLDAAGKRAKAVLIREKEVYEALMMARTSAVHGGGSSLDQTEVERRSISISQIEPRRDSE